jgi:hypothetical protein
METRVRVRVDSLKEHRIFDYCDRAPFTTLPSAMENNKQETCDDDPEQEHQEDARKKKVILKFFFGRQNI